MFTDDIIAGETNRMFYKGIQRYAKKYAKELNEVNVLLYLKSQESEGYQIYVDGQFKEEVTIKDLLGVKLIDIKGYSLIAPPNILKFLKKYATELNSMKVDISVYMNEDCDDVRYFLYNEGKFVKEVDLVELLKEKVT